MITNTGKGKDRKGTKRDGLLWSWRWIPRNRLSGWPQADTRRLPCCTCEAARDIPGMLIDLRATEYCDEDYVGSLELNGRPLLKTGKLKARLDAQRAAEGLVQELYKMVAHFVFSD